MSTVLIGGIVLGVAVLTGIVMMGKKKENREDTGFGVENEQYEQTAGRRTRRHRTRSRSSKRVKI